MALTPQDKAYWEDKLGWKGFVYLLVGTVSIGCFIGPLFLYLVSWMNGHADQWSWALALEISESNFMLALLVAIMVWCIGRLYLWMEWLPSRS